MNLAVDGARKGSHILPSWTETGEEARTTRNLASSTRLTSSPACPTCQSNQGQWRGYRTRKDGAVFHRRWCKRCGKWTQTRFLAGHEALDWRDERLAYDAWTEAHEESSPEQEVM